MSDRMSDEKLKDVGELGLLALLRPMLERHTAGMPLGTGDDVAMTAHEGRQRLAWTIDTMIEGTHFRWWNDPLATAASLGYKLVAVNASDLASKGAAPFFGLISIGVPAGESTERIRDFYQGVDEGFAKLGGRLIGGDTVRAPQWCVTLALVGEVAADLTIAARSNAKPGQGVYVTRATGDSAAGLAILEGTLSAPEPARSTLINAHLRPQLSASRGIELVRKHPGLAMIDVSDGIVNDCGQIARSSSTCIDVYTSGMDNGEWKTGRKPIPISDALLEACDGDRAKAEKFALYGGEDYCLLFCTPQPVDENDSCFQIGEVVAGSGVRLVSPDGTHKAPQMQGFSHFQ
ncbi:MAG: thiamine-phosphate kinase [Candidatus Sumerlaeota bacterium]